MSAPSRPTPSPDAHTGPPRVRIAAVVVVYGALALLAVAQAAGAASAVQSVAAAMLLAVGAPWLAVQGIVTVVLGTPTWRHRAVAILSLAYPAVVVTLYLALKLRR